MSEPTKTLEEMVRGWRIPRLVMYATCWQLGKMLERLRRDFRFKVQN